jgi:hypothetical protein
VASEQQRSSGDDRGRNGKDREADGCLSAAVPGSVLRRRLDFGNKNCANLWLDFDRECVGLGLGRRRVVLESVACGLSARSRGSLHPREHRFCDGRRGDGVIAMSVAARLGESDLHVRPRTPERADGPPREPDHLQHGAEQDVRKVAKCVEGTACRPLQGVGCASHSNARQARRVNHETSKDSRHANDDRCEHSSRARRRP